MWRIYLGCHNVISAESWHEWRSCVHHMTSLCRYEQIWDLFYGEYPCNVTAGTFSLFKLAAAVGRYVVFVCLRHVAAGIVCEWKVDERENMHTIRWRHWVVSLSHRNLAYFIPRQRKGVPCLVRITGLWVSFSFCSYVHFQPLSTSPKRLSLVKAVTWLSLVRIQ